VGYKLIQWQSSIVRPSAFVELLQRVLSFFLSRLWWYLEKYSSQPPYYLIKDIEMITIKGILSAAALALLATTAVPSLAATTMLTAGVWTISGSDEARNNWTGSTITFETQSAIGNDDSVSGYFYWTGNGGSYYGRENFAGTLFENNHLTVGGFELVPPTSGIVTGVTFEADITADGHHMVNGTWGGVGIPSQAWTAVQAVPEPSNLALLLPGLAMLAFATRKRLL
jgi:hypothetical protein